MPRLEPTEYQRLLQAETERISSIPEDSLGAEIPHIEGWTVHSVVGHIGWLLRYISLCLQAPPDQAPPRSAVGEPPVGADVLGWFADAIEEAGRVIDSADLEELHPSWTGPKSTEWWLRRTSLELAIHRWDAYSAIGGPDPIETNLAQDGIDEVLEVFVPNRMQFDILAASGETIHLHATDLEGSEWLLELLADEIRWKRTAALSPATVIAPAAGKGDVAAKGTTSDLLLLVWSRLPPSRLELFGEVTILDRWQQAAKF